MCGNGYDDECAASEAAAFADASLDGGRLIDHAEIGLVPIADVPSFSDIVLRELSVGPVIWSPNEVAARLLNHCVRGYASASRPTMTSLHQVLRVAVDVTNAHARSERSNEIPMPSFGAFRSRVRTMNSFEVYPARFGKDAARMGFHPNRTESRLAR